MSLCINPDCKQPQNSDNYLFCQACGSELLLTGRYRVMRLLSNKGGFGATYEVIHNNQPKVLKILTNSHPEAIRLFQQEAQILMMLEHPGIPKGEGEFSYFPRDSQNSIHCFVMEKIEGLDLEDYQKQRRHRPIDQKLALEWLKQLVEILHAVHSQNFFHRDIKPSNIILKPDGQLTLIDFGAVRQVTATIMAGKQNTGIYTPGYAPPEQEKGYAVTQSDFFALGRTFVYLLTGKEPTDSSMYDHYNNELKWRDFAPQVSPQLADFLDQLMMERATRRPVNTSELLEGLTALEQQILPSSTIRPTGNPAPPTVVNPEPRTSQTPSSTGGVASTVPQTGGTSPPTGQSAPTIPQTGGASPTVPNVQPSPTIPQSGGVSPTIPHVNAPGAGIPGVAVPDGTTPNLTTVSQSKNKLWTRRNVIIAGGLVGGGAIASGVGLIKYLHYLDTRPKIVAQAGGGDYETLREAIQNSRPGGKIFIGPGTYNETLLIDKPLTIIGQGSQDEIIIETTDNHCVIMQAKTATVQGLTLRCRAGSSDKFAVDISQGELLLENCDITSNSLSCISIQGSQANPTIRNCRVHDCKEAGFFIRDNAQATIENCEIYSNTLSGVEVKQNANPIIRNCKVYDGQRNGFFIWQNAQATLENCRIYGNALFGVEIREGAAPKIRNCEMANEGGVFVRDEGRGIIENCDITSKKYAGLDVTNNGDPTMRNCKIYEGQGAGVLVYGNGLGKIENCQIVNHAYSGIEIRDKGNPLVENCRVNQNQGYGLYAHDNAKGVVRNCNFTNNKAGAWLIDDTSQIDRTGNIT
jgi:parallel beta-helix repeat protein